MAGFDTCSRYCFALSRRAFRYTGSEAYLTLVHPSCTNRNTKVPRKSDLEALFSAPKKYLLPAWLYHTKFVPLDSVLGAKHFL